MLHTGFSIRSGRPGTTSLRAVSWRKGAKAPRDRQGLDAKARLQLVIADGKVGWHPALLGEPIDRLFFFAELIHELELQPLTAGENTPVGDLVQLAIAHLPIVAHQVAE